MPFALTLAEPGHCKVENFGHALFVGRTEYTAGMFRNVVSHFIGIVAKDAVIEEAAPGGFFCRITVTKPKQDKIQTFERRPVDRPFQTDLIGLTKIIGQSP